jgi:glycosyltransferase involved in cell wall biosynthesis
MIILTFTPFYQPGYRAGGPIKSIRNLVDQLGDEFEFWIVCSDRDIGDKTPYPNITCNQWIKVGQAHIFYLPPENQTIKGFLKIFKETPHDAVYLNSIFSYHYSIIPLIIRKLLGDKFKPTIIAPRGEFSPGALAIKSFKKNLFLRLANYFKLHSGITWQASSKHEASDIKRTINKQDHRIKVASDLINIETTPNLTGEFNLLPSAFQLDSSIIRIVFLSRISPKKNLEFALNILTKVNVKVTFDIIGPKEDLDYWEYCQDLLEHLPPNVTAQYCGIATPDEISNIMQKYDIFFFPTFGENFGHVIFEALSAGTPVLISDQTPWRNLKHHGAGWDLSLQHPDQFLSVIHDYSELSTEEKMNLRKTTLNYARKISEDPIALEANRNLFRFEKNSLHE